MRLSVSKFSLICLAFLLLFPSALSSAHYFTGHEHVFCNHYSDSHFHQESVDCQLFKFHRAAYTSTEISDFVIFNPKVERQKSTSFYCFLSEYEKLSFALRGPPARG
ncbi:MAG TPA: hypothetical protein VFM59_01710 [Salinimicrobium sp.]|nr:hypothetical protein [Salinimicrobium sp.]